MSDTSVEVSTSALHCSHSARSQRRRGAPRADRLMFVDCVTACTQHQSCCSGQQVPDVVGIQWLIPPSTMTRNAGPTANVRAKVGERRGLPHFSQNGQHVLGLFGTTIARGCSHCAQYRGRQQGHTGEMGEEGSLAYANPPSIADNIECTEVGELNISAEKSAEKGLRRFRHRT